MNIPLPIKVILSRFVAALRGTYFIRPLSELPEVKERGVLYLLGDCAPWSVALLCPCRCGSLIQLSLIETDSPKWVLELSLFGLPTLSPSVWRTKGCEAHFILTRGRIHWCGAKYAPLRRL